MLVDEDAERSALSALMLADADSSIAAEIVAKVTPRDFHRGAHRTICEALVDLRLSRQPCDPITVADHLARVGKLDGVGGRGGLVDIAQASPSVATGVHHAGIVADLAHRRRIQTAASTLAGVVADPETDPESAVADLVDKASRSQSVAVHRGADLIEQVLAVDDGPLGWAPPWPSMSDVWRVVPGWVHVITGFPSAGKSAWIDALIVGMCEEHGVRASVWSPESAPIARHARRLAQIRRRATLSDPSDLVESATWVADRVAWIDHDDAQTLPAILARAATVRPRPELLVIDPFTDVEKWDGGGDEGWATMLERQLNRLRSWARTHQVAVLVVAHPKGIARNRDGRYPVATISDLMGGSIWRNKVDSAVSVWRDDTATDQSGSETHIHVQKVREQPAAGQMGRRYDMVRLGKRGGWYEPLVRHHPQMKGAAP